MKIRKMVLRIIWTVPYYFRGGKILTRFIKDHTFWDKWDLNKAFFCESLKEFEKPIKKSKIENMVTPTYPSCRISSKGGRNSETECPQKFFLNQLAFNLNIGRC